MGDALYHDLRKAFPDLPCRTYAPVGGHRDLLAYLVRRLLENGANSSFVAASTDDDLPIDALLKRPSTIIGAAEDAHHPSLPKPPALFGAARRNSHGFEFGHRASLDALTQAIARARTAIEAASIIDGRPSAGASTSRYSPIDTQLVGRCIEASPDDADRAMAAARAGFASWRRASC